MTVPFPGPLHAQREPFQQLEALGYTDLWSAEASGVDGLTPLALASVWTDLRLGTAILPAFTRGPALMAQSIAGLASAAPGRFVAGIGSSSNIIVENWNAIPFDEPFKRTRDLVRFLRVALSGEKVVEAYDTFEVKGFRLTDVPEQPVPILVAALREGMLRLAGREGDGAIVNWLSADDVTTVARLVNEQGPDKEIVARLFVCPSADRDAVLPMAKYAMAAYLNVPVYRAFHEWMGRGEALAEHWEQWAAGDRKGALEKIPDAVVDQLIIHGSVDECFDHIQRYLANGITCPALMLMPLSPFDMAEAVAGLAPRSS
ncbi:MAG: LLM class F420-dependent oxidoreductase [Acidimicrobiia bacterium]|nr:LLM class F420-dependent oxidoreductase [Acidimicrobiia bacterium]MDH5237878.1 LLM class F420-dependent oxidoreductase [Acidimicrobiia bacterium]